MTFVWILETGVGDRVMRYLESNPALETLDAVSTQTTNLTIKVVFWFVHGNPLGYCTVQPRKDCSLP